jgi:HAD superfamily hydrolase (TIGR01490 family)
MIKLALFDVDYTLTKKETLISFFKFMLKKHPSDILYVPAALASGSLFKLGFFNEKQAKELFLRFLKGKSVEEIDALADEFFVSVFRNILYKDGIRRLQELKEKDYFIILTSASPEFYIKKLGDMLKVDKIMGTRFEIKDGIFTSKMLGHNNKGVEKVLRLYEYLNGMEIDYENSYMFSDSLSDDPLLKIVGYPYLINYKKKNPKYPVLNWR